MRLHYVIIAIVVLSCSGKRCQPSTPEAGSDAAVTQARVFNKTATSTTVYAQFGADSEVGPADWPFCGDASPCSFPLAADAGQSLPTLGKHLNVTLSFDQSPQCTTTLGELDIGNPQWTEDTANISLVNGWSNDIEIDVSGSQTLGPTKGPNGNASIYGVYPNGCDICVARQSPPCGISPCGGPDGSPASCGCKAGTQYNPTVPCQASFARGSNVTVALDSH